jgi:TPR repeat protein
VAKQLSKSPVPIPVNQPAPLTVPSIPEPKPTPKTVTSTPEELWSSVRAGDTRAAVALADLYLHGDGVSQNCDQARVLLAAASKENNAEAIRKLQDLDQNGCPAP